MATKNKLITLDRQLRWNITGGDHHIDAAQLTKWTILAINTPDKISRIKGNILVKMQPIVWPLDEKDMIKYSGSIPQSGGGQYAVFCFETPRGSPWYIRQVYDGKSSRDRELYERTQDKAGLETYVLKLCGLDSAGNPLKK